MVTKLRPRSLCLRRCVAFREAICRQEILWGQTFVFRNRASCSLKALVEAGDAHLTYFNDQLSTPILQTKTAGAVSWRAEYAPYGSVFSSLAGSSLHQPLRFPEAGEWGWGVGSHPHLAWQKQGHTHATQ